VVRLLEGARQVRAYGAVADAAMQPGDVQATFADVDALQKGWDLLQTTPMACGRV
jgi:hypothetical protein